MTSPRPAYLVGLALIAVGASCLTCLHERSPGPLRRPEPSPPAPPAQPSRLGAGGASGEGGGSALISPTPLVSRGKRITGWSPRRFSDPKHAVDGDQNTSWEAGSPTPDKPAWLAIKVDPGPTRLILSWSASGSFNYDETDYGSPGAYRIETSADSKNGEDGSWRTVASVPRVTTHGQAHGFDFAGQRWVRMVITEAPQKSPNGVQIDEIAVHDASAGAADTWFFMGDSITAFAFGRGSAGPKGFAALISSRHRGHTPVVINGGIGGDKSDEGVKHIEQWLQQNPDARFWGLGYGTNDAAGDAADPGPFKANMQAIIEQIRAAGRTPILATIPFATDGQHAHIPRFNAAIDELRRAHSLPPGPDLYTWFKAHPDELSDNLHPNDRGIASINRLWAEAVAPLYGR